MNWTPRRKRFRELIAGNRCYHPGSVFDAISARIAEDLGFEVEMFAGSIASMTVLGAPDLTVITLTEFADQIYRICRAANTPLMVDADHGYGNALNVMRTVQELETAGVAGMTIEDTWLPRAFGPGGTKLISVEEGIGKLRAAVSARQDPDLVIIGRSSAVETNGLEDAVARFDAYQKTGVDALFLVGLKTRQQLEAIAAIAKLPLMVGSLTPELNDREYLASRGVRVALQGHQPFMAAVQATHATLKALRDGVAPSALPNLPSAALMKRVTRDADYADWTRDFLS
jgi:oxaloacetate decarboxylase